MAKAKAPAPIDCERCRNFTGNAFWLRFACAKGHTDKDEAHYYGLQRRDCADYDQASRAELIFMRRKSSFSGGEAMLKDARTVKRTATTLRNLVEENALGQYLEAKELEHFRAAIGALDALAPDLTRAAKLGERYKAEQLARMQARHEEAMLRLVAEALPNSGGDAVIAVVEDLHQFSRNWRSTPAEPGDQPMHAAVRIYEGDSILRALAACRKAPTPAALKTLTVELGEQIERMRQGDRPNSGGWRDFIGYRKYLTLQRQMVSGALPPSDPNTTF
ncbi:MAG: hypothetical protein AzoDbin1_04024 [Azoarcus sp.]|nr:hypothetical protein [Azoarcus sp.]